VQRSLYDSSSKSKCRVSYAEKVMCFPFIVEMGRVLCRECYTLLHHRSADYTYAGKVMCFCFIIETQRVVWSGGYWLLLRARNDRLKLF
jgi:hypothetical protein